MKHVFLVNSHTTFLSSLGVINLLKIANKDVVMLFARNYTNSVCALPYTLCDVNELYYSADDVFFTKDSDIISKKIKEVDTIVDNHIRGFYHMYVPNFCNPLVCLLYSNWKCRRISFIQEAAQSTVSAYKTNISVWNGLKRRLRLLRDGIPYRKWIMPLYYRNDYIWKQYGKMYSYALNDNIFAGFKSNINHIINWPVIDYKFNLNEEATFFVVDGWVKNFMCESEVFLQLMKSLIEENVGSFNYIKFHPNQITSEREQILDFFKNCNAPYEIMDQSIPFELVITTYQGLKIVGMGSALCFFAKDLHHNVICHDDWCYEKSEMFRRHIELTGNKLFKDYYAR